MITPKQKVFVRIKDLFLLRKKVFLENVETKELFLVEEYNRYTEKFEKTLIFNTQKEQLRYIDIMNEGLSTLKVRPSQNKLKLVLDQTIFNSIILNMEKYK